MRAQESTQSRLISGRMKTARLILIRYLFWKAGLSARLSHFHKHFKRNDEIKWISSWTTTTTKEWNKRRGKNWTHPQAYQPIPSVFFCSIRCEKNQIEWKQHSTAGNEERERKKNKTMGLHYIPSRFFATLDLQRERVRREKKCRQVLTRRWPPCFLFHCEREPPQVRDRSENLLHSSTDISLLLHCFVISYDFTVLLVSNNIRHPENHPPTIRGPTE